MPFGPNSYWSYVDQVSDSKLGNPVEFIEIYGYFPAIGTSFRLMPYIPIISHIHPHIPIIFHIFIDNILVVSYFLQFSWTNPIPKRLLRMMTPFPLLKSQPLTVKWSRFFTANMRICSTIPIAIPIGSMYGIYANIWGILMVNVTIYSLHGSYGIWFNLSKIWFLKKKRRVTSNQPGPPFDRRLSLASPQRCYRSCRRDCLTRADPLPERRNGSVTIHGRKFTEDSWNMVDDIYAVDMVYIYMGYRTIIGTSRVTTYQPSILGATFFWWLNPHDTESTTEIFWNELWSCNVATKHLLAHPSCLGNVIYIYIYIIIMYIYIYIVFIISP